MSNINIKYHRTMHISTNIDGLLAQSDKHLQDMAHTLIVDGKPCRTAKEVRAVCKEAQAQGWRLLPALGCDNFDPQKGCLGHLISD